MVNQNDFHLSSSFRSLFVLDRSLSEDPLVHSSFSLIVTLSSFSSKISISLVLSLVIFEGALGDPSSLEGDYPARFSPPQWLVCSLLPNSKASFLISHSPNLLSLYHNKNTWNTLIHIEYINLAKSHKSCCLFEHHYLMVEWWLIRLFQYVSLHIYWLLRLLASLMQLSFDLIK